MVYNITVRYYMKDYGILHDKLLVFCEINLFVDVPSISFKMSYWTWQSLMVPCNGLNVLFSISKNPLPKWSLYLDTFENTYVIWNYAIFDKLESFSNCRIFSEIVCNNLSWNISRIKYYIDLPKYFDINADENSEI